jgi:phosphoesterase RecJ-like protein
VSTRTRGARVRRPAASLVADTVHADAGLATAGTGSLDAAVLDTAVLETAALDAGVRDTAALDSEMDVATELLLRARDVVLVAHVHPDADALGSAMALGMGLARRGTPVAVSFAEPVAIPESLRNLPGGHLVVRPEQLPENPDLLVSLDVGSVERLGSLARLLDTCRQSLVIDHHPSNTRFGQFHLVDPSAEATVVLVARLLDRLGIAIDRQIADNLYAGLATDTGHFRHADSAAHQLAARLIDAGVRPEEVMFPITESHPFGWLGMLSAVLGGAVLDREVAHGQGLVYTVIDDVTRGGLRPEELDSVIDILRTAQEAAVAAVLKQTDEHIWQVSLRSRGDIDVAAVAGALGGGGHVRAAGFTHHGDPLLAIDALRAVLAD